MLVSCAWTAVGDQHILRDAVLLIILWRLTEPIPTRREDAARETINDTLMLTSREQQRGGRLTQTKFVLSI